jgi:hypothetical protein
MGPRILAGGQSRARTEMKLDYRTTKEGKRRFRFPGFYRFTVLIQSALWRIGIPWHNRFSDECTPDFNCCNKKP